MCWIVPLIERAYRRLLHALCLLYSAMNRYCCFLSIYILIASDPILLANPPLTEMQFLGDPIFETQQQAKPRINSLYTRIFIWHNPHSSYYRSTQTCFGTIQLVADVYCEVDIPSVSIVCPGSTRKFAVDGKNITGGETTLSVPFLVSQYKIADEWMDQARSTPEVAYKDRAFHAGVLECDLPKGSSTVSFIGDFETVSLEGKFVHLEYHLARQHKFGVERYFELRLGQFVSLDTQSPLFPFVSKIGETSLNKFSYENFVIERSTIKRVTFESGRNSITISGLKAQSEKEHNERFEFFVIAPLVLLLSFLLIVIILLWLIRFRHRRVSHY
jgi:hypothetical protein